MVDDLREWISCPSCDSGDTGFLAYGDMLSVECYDCGVKKEFTLGEPPLHELDI